MTPLPRFWAACIATVSAAILAAAMIGYAMGHEDPLYILRLAISPIGLIAFAQMGLAGPPLLRLVSCRRPLDWPGAALLGLLVGGLPAAVALVTLGPLRAAFGEELPLQGWVIGVAALALSGMAGGLIFHALCGGDRK